LPYLMVRSENNPVDNNRSKIMLMPIFDKKTQWLKKPNNKEDRV